MRKFFGRRKEVVEETKAEPEVDSQDLASWQSVSKSLKTAQLEKSDSQFRDQ